MPRPRTEKLRVIERKDNADALTIVGTIGGIRIRQRASTNNRATAEKEAAVLARDILNRQWHGEKIGSRTFAEAVTHYLKTSQRQPQTIRLLERILAAMGGPIALANIDQEYVNELKPKMMHPDAKAGSITAQLIVPLRAVMNLACEAGWCAPPRFKAPKPLRKGEGKRTDFYRPEDAVRLLQAAAPYFRPTLLAFLCTGLRHTEAVTLDWAQVSLAARTLTILPELAKTGAERIAHMPPALVAALSALPHREGAVFRKDDGQPYLAYLRRNQSFPEKGKNRQRGGIEGALDAAIKRAGVRRLTCHALRHTWASWWYAANGKDLLGLRNEGGWSSVTMVERYAHHGVAGYEDEIRAFWHEGDTGLVSLVKNIN